MCLYDPLETGHRDIEGEVDQGQPIYQSIERIIAKCK